MKKNVELVIDTETCNVVPSEDVMRGNNLVYNIGYQIVTSCDGVVIKKRSYLVKEIFVHEAERMNSCYYANKIPGYLYGIFSGEHQIASFFDIMNEINHDCKEYGVNAICAHNASFDVDALNTTARYLTGFNYIRALPQGIEIWDSMKMARSVFGSRPSYRSFCEDNGFMTKHQTPRPRLTAEVLYRYITKNIEFEEEHTALADVKIETEIIIACFRSHKKFERVIFPA